MRLRLTRSNIPVLATALVLIGLYATASVLYWDRHFCSVESAANLLRNYAFLGIAAIGMTFVILTGGIDLSVGSILGLTGMIGPSKPLRSRLCITVAPTLRGRMEAPMTATD